MHNARRSSPSRGSKCLFLQSGFGSPPGGAAIDRHALLLVGLTPTTDLVQRSKTSATNLVGVQNAHRRAGRLGGDHRLCRGRRGRRIVHPSGCLRKRWPGRIGTRNKAGQRRSKLKRSWGAARRHRPDRQPSRGPPNQPPSAKTTRSGGVGVHVKPALARDLEISWRIGGGRRGRRRRRAFVTCCEACGVPGTSLPERSGPRCRLGQSAPSRSCHNADNRPRNAFRVDTTGRTRGNNQTGCPGTAWRRGRPMRSPWGTSMPANQSRSAHPMAMPRGAGIANRWKEASSSTTLRSRGDAGHASGDDRVGCLWWHHRRFEWPACFLAGWPRRPLGGEPGWIAVPRCPDELCRHGCRRW